MVERTRTLQIEVTVIGDEENFATIERTQRMIEDIFEDVDDIHVTIKDFDREVDEDALERETDLW